MLCVLKQLRFILTSRQKRGVVFLFFASVIIAAFDTAFVALMAPFMALLTAPDDTTTSSLVTGLSTFWGERTLQESLMALCGLFIVLSAVRGILKVSYNYFQNRTIALYRTDLTLRLYDDVMHKPYAYHLRHNTAETQRLVTYDVSNVFALLSTLLQSLSACCVAVGILGVLFSLDFLLTLAVILIVGIIAIFFLFAVRRSVRKYAQANYHASAEMNKLVSQSIGGLKNILVSRRQSYYVDTYRTVAHKAAISNSNYYTVDAFPKIMIDAACMVLIFGTVLVYLVLGYDTMSALPSFATFALAATRLIPVAGQVTSTSNTIGFFRPSVDAVYQILTSGELEATKRTKTEEKEDQNPAVKNHHTLISGVQLEDISFCYSDSDTPLYTGLNLFIPAKTSVAFVGTTGSGKTTLADIILGLHKPTSGRVLADGIDTAENPQWWSSLLGYIPQFIYLCDDTIRANVAFGIPSQNIDDSKVWQCLDRAQIGDFVRSLPCGLDTIVGENGERLSGGQRQRIGIARALYGDPQLLLMDEATSSLDGETEKAIVDSINALSGDITLLIIAHRLSTIENCDIVYRIENGRATVERTKR